MEGAQDRKTPGHPPQEEGNIHALHLPQELETAPLQIIGMMHYEASQRRSNGNKGSSAQ